LGVPPLSQECKKQEMNAIIQIARNNGYPFSIITQLNNNIKNKNDNTITDCTHTPQQQQQRYTWTTAITAP
jgi:hypothetical protein